MKTKTLFTAWMSLISVILTVIPASVVHFYDFGLRSFIAGALIILLIVFLFSAFIHTKNKLFLVLYGLLNAFVILGFGIFRGFWNHAFKVFLACLHNGLPPLFSGMFLDPGIGSIAYEAAGIAVFAASMFAAYFSWKFIGETIKEEKNELNG